MMLDGLLDSLREKTSVILASFQDGETALFFKFIQLLSFLFTF